jgi:hypothetical protein
MVKLMLVTIAGFLAITSNSVHAELETVKT